MKDEYVAHFGISFIQGGRTKKNVAKALERLANISNIQRKVTHSILSKGPLPIIPEEKRKEEGERRPSKEKFKNLHPNPLPEV